MYFQRYMPHLPAGGEVVLFTELVQPGRRRTGDGLRTEEQVAYFLMYAPFVEQAIINSGVILVKYWLEETMEDQTERFEERIHHCPQDLEARARWTWIAIGGGTTTRGPRRDVRGHGHPRIAVVRGGFARSEARALDCISHLLSLISYHEVPHEEVKLPKRQPKGDYAEPNYPFRWIPRRY